MGPARNNSPASRITSTLRGSAGDERRRAVDVENMRAAPPRRPPSRVRLVSGQRGRFYIRRRQHERLVAEGGVYVFAVYEEAPGRPIRGLRVAAADAVDALLPDGWTDVDGPRSETGYRQLAWSRLLDTVTVEGDAETAATDGGRDECSVCGAPVRAVVTVGPGEHYAEPCGHRVSGACVSESTTLPDVVRPDPVEAGRVEARDGAGGGE